MPAIIEQHQNTNALIVPVILRESCWRGYFGHYIEVTPKKNGNLVPVYDWPKHENALAVAANSISASSPPVSGSGWRREPVHEQASPDRADGRPRPMDGVL